MASSSEEKMSQELLRKLQTALAQEEAARVSRVPSRQMELHQRLSRTTPEVRQAYAQCVGRMCQCSVRGGDRAVFLGTAAEWTKALGQRLGAAHMRTLADLLTLFAQASLHPNQKEFSLDIRELDYAWNGIHDWAC